MRRARLLVGSKLALIVGLLVFVVLAWLIELLLGLDRPVSLSPPLAILLAAIPGGLWLAFFHLQDRHEPEPKRDDGSGEKQQPPLENARTHAFSVGRLSTPVKHRAQRGGDYAAALRRRPPRRGDSSSMTPASLSTSSAIPTKR